MPRTGRSRITIGSWAPPWGIEYRVDALNAFVLVLVSGMAAVTVPYAWRSVAAELPRDQEYLFYTMFCLCLAGLLGMTITGDAFNLFVFLEIASLSSYVLVGLGRDRRALLAAYQYLVLGTIGATFYVIGIGLLYLATGTLNIADLAQRLQQVDKSAAGARRARLHHRRGRRSSSRCSRCTLAAERLHLRALGGDRVPRRHRDQGLGLCAAALLLQRVRPASGLRDAADAGDPARAVGRRDRERLAGGGLPADLKRLFAYSSVAQIGYITLGMSLTSRDGLTAAVVHLFNHGITKGAMFLLLGGVALRVGRAGLDRVRGLGRAMPLTSLGIVLAGFRLIGMPGTAGFISKWYLVLGAIETGHWWLAAFVVASSLIAVAYVWRFVEAAYLREPDARTPRAGRSTARRCCCRPGSWSPRASISASTPGTRSRRARRAAQLLLGAAR